ncbi:MAG: AsmA-like C-terminal region-containing protein, partial [Woeseia sp.]
PLGSVTAKIRLQDGHLLAEPFSMETADGNSTLRVDLHTRRSLLEGVVDIKARGLNLSDMLADLDIAADSFGIVNVQGKFWVQGDSVASVVGSADGGLMLLMTGGQLDALLIEVAGLDIGEASLAASGLYNPASIDCAYASLYSTDGVLDIDQFVIDTSDTTFFLNGTVDFGEETLDLALFPGAKDVSFPTADSPLAFTGSLKQPEVNLISGELVARALSAAALAALAGPVAALLPFVETGLQEEPDECKGWVEKLESEQKDES